MRRHVVNGDLVYTIFLTSGEKGGHGLPPEETGPLREREARTAAEIIGIDGFEFWRQPDNALSATRQLVEKLCKVIQEKRPDILYVPHNREMHPDHRAAARIVKRSLSIPDAPTVPVVLMFEVWTPMQHIDEVVDISSYLEIKMAAIRAYKSQCDVLRFDEAFLGLGRYRGELYSWPCGDYAEIFMRMRV